MSDFYPVLQFGTLPDPTPPLLYSCLIDRREVRGGQALLPARAAVPFVRTAPAHLASISRRLLPASCHLLLLAVPFRPAEQFQSLVPTLIIPILKPGVRMILQHYGDQGKRRVSICIVLFNNHLMVFLSGCTFVHIEDSDTHLPHEVALLINYAPHFVSWALETHSLVGKTENTGCVAGVLTVVQLRGPTHAERMALSWGLCLTTGKGC